MSDDNNDPVDNLDDDSLYREMRKYKPDVGPIVDSTRNLYRKMLRKSLDGPLFAHVTPAASTSAPATTSPVLIEQEEESPRMSAEVPAVPARIPSQKGTRSSRGRLSTSSAVTTEAVTSRPDPEPVESGSGLKQRINRRVSFDDNVEWVQNDPEEEPASLSFFLKAVLIGAFLCLILTLAIIAWADSQDADTR